MAKNSNYSKKLKAIRAFVNFNYDLRKTLTKSQKAKISKYYNKIQSIKQNSHHIYRPKNNTNKNIALKYAGQKPDKNIKVVFIPGKAQVKIKIKGGKLHAYSKYIHTGFHPLDAAQLLADPDGVINRILKSRPHVLYWGIVTERGDGSIDTLGDISHRDLLLKSIKRYGTRYGSPQENNYIGNWLHGLQEMSFHDQEEAGEYYAAKNKAKKKKYKTRKGGSRRA